MACALAALPGAASDARKASIAQAIQAEDKAAGITPQTRILADEILRFDGRRARRRWRRPCAACWPAWTPTAAWPRAPRWRRRRRRSVSKCQCSKAP
ncbi:hypothetical protein WJ972_19865 [Achromobacter insuavis]